MAAVASSLPVLRDIERLSPIVIRILGGNPGRVHKLADCTDPGTNTYLIGRGSRRILLDTGAGEPAWKTSLKQVLDSEQATVGTALISHWHGDHISGVPDLLELCPDAKVHKNNLELSGDDDWLEISDGDQFTAEGATLTALHTPGHTEDHMTFQLAEEDALFTADNVLGHGTTVFEDLGAYMTSLERMRTSFKGRGYPGHGDVIQDGVGTIAQYIGHRQAREKQVVRVLGQPNAARGADPQGWTSMELVKIIYRDIATGLQLPAEKGVYQILMKLEGDHEVVQYDDAAGTTLWKLSDSARSKPPPPSPSPLPIAPSSRRSPSL